MVTYASIGGPSIEVVNKTFAKEPGRGSEPTTQFIDFVPEQVYSISGGGVDLHQRTATIPCSTSECSSWDPR